MTTIAPQAPVMVTGETAYRRWPTSREALGRRSHRACLRCAMPKIGRSFSTSIAWLNPYRGPFANLLAQDSYGDHQYDVRTVVEPILEVQIGVKLRDLE